MRSAAAKSLELAEAQYIDQVCERFEAAWQAEPRPRIEAYVAEASEQLQPHLIEELVALETELRRRAGEQPTLAEYLGRFPEQAARLEVLFRSTPELRTPAVAAATSERDTGPSTPVLQQPNEGGAGPPSPTGRYRPVRLHARGGLGEVHLAEDRELGRPVALKRIQPRHAAHPESRRRFLREAELTARLEHPGIVPVHGLVQDVDGQPCYAMRFIEGESLKEAIARFHYAASGQEGSGAAVRTPTDLADAYHALPFRQLLGCFVAVCKTIAYAHSRNIIHRDLKPSNIMLGRYGETLVVDWGLAKSLEPAGTGPSADEPAASSAGDAEEGTQPGMTMGTPAYMSPEQAAGQWDQVGPASDIYSLGATFYELLTGQAPYRGGSGPALEEVKQGTFAPPGQQQKAVPRPLEAICLKAMERQPEDRYATALDLAADVEQWLADEPVSAWPEPWTGRAGRWVKRHRMAGALALVVLLAALVVAAVAAVLSERERQAVALERDEKEVQRDKAVAARDEARIVVELMASEGQLQVLEKQAELSAQQKELLRALVAYYQRYVQEGATAEADSFRQAEWYFRIGWMQRRLGYWEEAITAQRHAVERLTQLTADFPTQAEYREKLAASHSNLGVLLDELGKRTEAEAAHRRALALREQLATDFPAEPQHRLNLATSRRNLGILLRELGGRTEAETEFRRALQLTERLAADFPAVPEYRQKLAASHNSLGVLLSEVGKRTEAVAEYRRALALYTQLAADFPAVPEYRQDSAKGHNNLGAMLFGLGKPTEAEAEYRRAMALLERLTADFPIVPDYRLELANSHNNLGVLLKESGQGEKAEAEYRRALALHAKLAADFATVPQYRQDLAMSHGNLGNLLSDLGRQTDAAAEHRRALELRERLTTEFPAVPKYRLDLAASHNNLGTLLAGMGKPAEAEAEYQRAHRLHEQLVGAFPGVPEYRQQQATSHFNRGLLLEAQGKYPEAEAEYRRALALRERLSAEFPAVPEYRQELARIHNNLAVALTQMKKPAEAMAAYGQALALNGKLATDFPAEPEYRQDLAKGRINLAGLLARHGKSAEARKEFVGALELLEYLTAQFPTNSAYALDLAAGYSNYAGLLKEGGQPAESLAWYGKALAILQPQLLSEPGLATVRQSLRITHWGRAAALDQLGRHAEAFADWQHAMKLGGRKQPEIRLGHARALARSGQPAQAAAEAEDLARDKRIPGWGLRECARVLALASAAAKEDALLQEQYAARAVAVLRQADAAGYFKDTARIAALKKEADFALLHGRDDFQKLLAGLKGE